jgi:transcription elongation factor GreA
MGIMSTVAHQPMPITREGFDRLQAELERLETATRREVAEWLRVAKEDGGEPGENLEVAAALEEQAALERRIDELEATLALARIAEPPTDGVAGIGQRVQIDTPGGPRVVEIVAVGEGGA